MNSDFWSQFEKQAPEKKKNQAPVKEGFWGQFEQVKEPPKEDESEALRHISRTGARIGEAALGLPGEVVELAKSLPEGPKIFQREPSFVQKAGKKLLEKLPTSQDLRKFTHSYFGDYTEPQGEWEKMGDDFTQDVTRMVIPGGKVKNAMYIATGANVVKKGMEKLGFSESAQDVGKLGTMFTLSLINPKGVQNFYTQKYRDAAGALPDVELPAKNLRSTLNYLESKLNQGITSEPTKKRVLSVVDNLRSKIQGGKINSKELWESKKDINKIMGDPELFQYAEHYFPRLTKRMNFLLKKSPELPKEFKDSLIAGDQAFGSLHQSQKASRFLKKLNPGKGIGGILIAQALHSPEHLPAVAGGLAAGGGVVKSYELLKRINSNPTMRKYYLNMIKSASEENAANAAHYMHKLEKELKD